MRNSEVITLKLSRTQLRPIDAILSHLETTPRNELLGALYTMSVGEEPPSPRRGRQSSLRATLILTSVATGLNVFDNHINDVRSTPERKLQALRSIRHSRPPDRVIVDEFGHPHEINYLRHTFPKAQFSQLYADEPNSPLSVTHSFRPSLAFMDLVNTFLPDSPRSSFPALDHLHEYISHLEYCRGTTNRTGVISEQKQLLRIALDEGARFILLCSREHFTPDEAFSLLPRRYIDPIMFRPNLLKIPDNSLIT